MALQTKNPATEEVLEVFEEIRDDELESKLSLADSAFKLWRNTTYQERARLMTTLAKYLRKHSDELSKLQTIEMGKTFSSGKPSVEKCASVCEYYAENTEKILSIEELPTADEERYVRFDPLGPVLAVMPWNFPYWQVYRFAAPAIMAGNVALLKHASNVPQCAQAIEESFRACGFPEGVFQNLRLSAARVEKVIRDKRVAAVTLTGSEKAGSDVARIAGEEIKKTVLELGGTDPFIVFSDADIASAVENALYARLQDNTGQSCIAAKRFVIHSDVIEEFTALLAEKLSTLVVGDPMNSATDVGPLATEQGLADVMRQVDESVQKGARIAYGGVRPEGKGYFYMPTIVRGVMKGMPAYDEEIFGPVFSIIEFTTVEEAIMIANDNPYGLGAAFFTRDRDLIKRLIPQIEAGNVFVNRFVKSDIRMPFGGVKRSGYGRELSAYGIKEFVNIKNVCIK
ncbi:MAG: NAD-dependent succinate-semialdehyde dehydrogenase [Patescibacteria group bacterium]